LSQLPFTHILLFPHSNIPSEPFVRPPAIPHKHSQTEQSWRRLLLNQTDSANRAQPPRPSPNDLRKLCPGIRKAVNAFATRTGFQQVVPVALFGHYVSVRSISGRLQPLPLSPVCHLPATLHPRSSLHAALPKLGGFGLLTCQYWQITSLSLVPSLSGCAALRSAGIHGRGHQVDEGV
jgi:hypothetical protein